MLSAKNQKNEPVDWWFIYKTPEHSGTPDNQGFDFFYYDADTRKLELSSQPLNKENQAFSNTLKIVFDKNKGSGYVVYNDEHYDKESNNSEKGHCKGILAFNKQNDTGLLLLHSTPRFPGSGEQTLPKDEEIYGQTFICITLPDFSTANQLASLMLSQQNPQILKESSHLPSNIGEQEPLSRLFHGQDIEESDNPSTLRFKSRGGKDFIMTAKSRKWGKDFWIDLVSPELNCDLIVETWRRGAVTPEEDGKSKSFDEDVLSLKFQMEPTVTYEWAYTRDHAKWAVALKNSLSTQPWVCIADLNRMVSQEKRGGGSLCFQEEELWQALMKAEEKLHKLNS